MDGPQISKRDSQFPEGDFRAPVPVINPGHSYTSVTDKLTSLVRKHFDLTPQGIIEKLKLRRPIYRKTAAYGHFGRSDFAWEKTDMAKVLAKAV